MLLDAEECVIHWKIPLMDIEAAVEGATCRMDNEKTASKLRGISAIYQGRLALHPLTSINTFKLREHKNITNLPPDKRHVTVLMDAAQYEKKINDLLEDPG